MIKIRPAGESDLAECLEIYRYYVENTAVTFEYTTPTPEEFRARFRAVTEKFPWLAAEENGRVAGYCYAAPAFERAAYQWDADISVYIGGEYQRRGIARAFYGAVHELLRAQGYYVVYALITGSNKKSLAFHNAMGYRQIGNLPESGYKFGSWHDVTWMEKTLREKDGAPEPPKIFADLPSDFTGEVLHRAERMVER